MSAGALASLLCVALASAPAATQPSVPAFHPGLGVMMRNAVPVAPAPTAVRRPPTARPPTPIPGIRPPSNADLLRQSRRARAFYTGMAVAVQAGMMVYGVMSLLDQRREVRRRNRTEPEPFDPYPR